VAAGNKDILDCHRTGAGRAAFFSLLTADALNATRKTLPALPRGQTFACIASLEKIKSSRKMFF
jgi:hypothetical protein